MISENDSLILDVAYERPSKLVYIHLIFEFGVALLNLIFHTVEKCLNRIPSAQRHPSTSHKASILNIDIERLADAR